MAQTYFKDASDNVYAFDGHQVPTAGLTPITVEEKDILIARKKDAAFRNLSYAEKRAAEYPPIADYVDGVVKGDAAQVQAYIDACLAVKAKYPKV